MNVYVTDKLVSVRDNKPLGYLVSAGSQYKVAVTQSFGEAHNVEDMSIAEFLDVNEIPVVPVGRSEYAVLESNIGYFEELADVPVERNDGKRICYGYVFKEQNIVPLDSEAAFERMLKDASGQLIE